MSMNIAPHDGEVKFGRMIFSGDVDASAAIERTGRLFAAAAFLFLFVRGVCVRIGGQSSPFIGVVVAFAAVEPVAHCLIRQRVKKLVAAVFIFYRHFCTAGGETVPGGAVSPL